MELYNSNDMPLSSIESKKIAQQKFLDGEKLSTIEKINLGRDHVIKECAGYKFMPDHAYRVISEELFYIYKEQGYIFGLDENDEYIEYEKNGKIYNNNRGINWYLGGACLRYGNVIIECPAYKKYFTPASDNGNSLSLDPTVKHLKSSGFNNPIPFNLITKAFKLTKNNGDENISFTFEELELTSKEKIK